MKTRPKNFHGVKGCSGAWNKRDEWDYRDLLKLSKGEIVRLAKKYKNAAGDQTDKHYKFWLEAALALILKDLPNKVASQDEDGNVVPLVVYLPEVKKDGF